MFWAGEKIRHYFPKEEIVSYYDPGKIDCNSYPLSIGPRFYVTSDFSGGRSNVGIQQFKSDAKHRSVGSGSIPSGHFAFLETRECINMPKNAMGFISLKTKKAKFRGLVNVSGFHVDPGYTGHLVFAVFNAGSSPIIIDENEVFFQLWIADIDISIERPRESINVKGINPKDTYLDSDIVKHLSAPLLSLQDFSDQMNRLRIEINEIQSKVSAASTVRNYTIGLVGVLLAAMSIGVAVYFGVSTSP